MGIYPSLAATLRELSLDVETKELDLSIVFEQIEEGISTTDMVYYRLFRTQYDIQNIINFIAGRTLSFNPMGLLTSEEIGQIVERFKDGGKSVNFSEGDFYGVAECVRDILVAYRDPILASDMEIDPSQAIEKSLQSSYYTKLVSSRDRFLKEWFQFDLDMRNICAAYSARLKQRDIASVVIGEGEIQTLLTTSQAADFGVTGAFDYAEELFSLLSLEDMLVKERKMDEIRWDKINDLTTFEYVSCDFILGYVAKLSIIGRWLQLDAKSGREMFNRLLAEFKGDKLNFDNIK